MLIKNYKQYLTASILLFLCMIAPAFADQTKPADEFDLLIQRLSRDGFETKQLHQIFAGKQVAFTPRGVSQFFIHSEASLNYDQFISQKSLSGARKYLKDHHKALERAQQLYGVDKTIITAIILVETRLGTYLGKHRVINTLATMASLSDPKLKERIWKSIPKNKRPKRAAFDAKVRKRSEWGYRELKALIKYTSRWKIKPETLLGSYAGAMGIPQFMPSNILNLAKDGNGDGKVDLFTHDDAIHSVANYLKHHGWKPGLARQAQHKVLFTYNHSNYYVDILLKISDKLKG